MKDKIIEINPEKVSGTPVFVEKNSRQLNEFGRSKDSLYCVQNHLIK
jgi:hypothetical protein